MVEGVDLIVSVGNGDSGVFLGDGGGVMDGYYEGCVSIVMVGDGTVQVCGILFETP